MGGAVESPLLLFDTHVLGILGREELLISIMQWTVLW